jgi:hypothetical protein
MVMDMEAESDRLVSESGSALVTVVDGTKFIWLDENSGISCNLTLKEDMSGFEIGQNCSLNWTNATFYMIEGEMDPSGVYGPNGELYTEPSYENEEEMTESYTYSSYSERFA